MIPLPLEEKLTRFIGKIHQATAVGGGCIHHALRIETDSGPLFLKWNDIGQAHNFQVEAKGLDILREASTLKVPEVYHEVTGGEFACLILEWIEQGTPARDYYADFGEKLAQMHLNTDRRFGLSYDNYIGSLPQYNRPYSTWTDFFRESRLMPQLKMKRAKSLLSSNTQKGFERLFTKLDSLIPEEPPALLHGDLWGGNILRNPDGHAVLIDPAVYMGHPEAELAFMQMFDSYPREFYMAYETVRPIAPGWQDRTELFNLYPLLVHVNLFGGSYVRSVEKIVERFA